MVNAWTLGGLSLPELLRRTARESWKDAVFGQGGRMAFYHFLAIFPSLLLFLVISSRVPHLGGPMRDSVLELSSQVLPDPVSQLLRDMTGELNSHALSGLQLVSVFAAGCWAALNGTWAMVYGLNKAYEVEEHRSWWELGITIIGLTLSLAIAGLIAAFLIFCGSHFRPYLRILEWIVLIMLLLLSFGVLYRFAPNLRDGEWRWSTPGSLCAVVLWIGSTLAARFYFDHVNNYARTYGHLNGVAMLLLWLYVTNGSILIGGEMNSEIEKAAVARKGDARSQADRQDRSGH